MGKVEATLYE
jgi:hypothetical protein